MSAFLSDLSLRGEWTLVTSNFKRVHARFNLGSFIASNIHVALLFANCDILGVKIIRTDPLDPNIKLYCVYYAVL